MKPAYQLRAEALRILRRLLEAYSPTGSEWNASKIAADEAYRLGYEDSWVDDVGSFHAERGQGPKVLLAGHIDTVPGYIEVKEENGFLQGRGAVDAKGPLTAFMLAGIMVEGCRIRVSGLAAEEGDSRGARSLISSGEKFDHIVVGEPTGLAIAIGYRGSNLVSIECKGAGGHSSSPEIGDSALDKLLSIASSAGELEGVSAAIVRLEASSPAHNMLPTEARGLVDFRFMRGYKLTIVPGCRLKALSYTPPVKVKPQAPVVRSLQRALLERGLKPKLVVKRGTSDMNLLQAITGSIAAFGPGDPRLSHTPWERVSVDEVVKASMIIASALNMLCRGRL